MTPEKEKFVSRKKFVRSFLAGTAGMAVLPAIAVPRRANDTVNGNAAAFDFLVQPYLQNLHPGAVSIHFITSGTAHAWIEYAETGQPPVKAQGSRNGLIEIGPNHCIRLTNLKPGTRYSYKVVAKEVASFQPYKLTYGNTLTTKEYAFITPAQNPETTSGFILNDIHDRPASFAKLFSVAAGKSSDWVILNGDMFDYMTDEPQVVKHLLVPCAEAFASEKPYYFLRGNHETRGVYARAIERYFTFETDKYYFEQRIGPVQFVFLDTGEDKPDDAPVYAGIADFDRFRSEQAAWLEKLAKTPAFKKAPFRVVVMHIPPFHSGDWHGTLHCRKLFAPLFEKYRIDMVISGHTHKYGVHAPSEEHSYPVIIGGGPKEGTRTIIHFTANQKEIHISMLKDDGTEVGTYTSKRK